MKNKKEIVKIVLYTLVFGKVMPEDTSIKEARKLAINITNNMTNNSTNKGGEK